MLGNMLLTYYFNSVPYSTSHIALKTDSITKKSKYRRKPNPARAFAMYVCQEYSNMGLKEIKQQFGLGHTGSASFSINKIRHELEHGEWKKEVKKLERHLYIVK